MAGIGFQLRTLLDEGTYFGTLKGYLFATYLVAGPWIVTAAVIGLLTTMSGLHANDYAILRTAIVYCYAYSLIFTGTYQMPLTRYIADEIYLGRIQSLAPAYLGISLITISVLGTFGMAYGLLFPLSWLFRFTFTACITTIGLLWVAGIFLGCLRNYHRIGVCYTVGSLFSFIGALYGRHLLGLDGAFLGFTAGQVCTLFGLSYGIISELGFPGLKPSFECLEALGRFKLHLFIGLFYSLTIWVDKMIYWYSPIGETACRGLYSFGHYDSAIYISYVTIIPALGMFMLSIETSFYEAYRDFYGVIQHKFPLNAIRRRRDDIERSLSYSFFELLKIQGVITFLCFYFAPEVLSRFGFPTEMLKTLRMGLWAAFFHALFLFGTLLLLYFDFKREAFAGNAIHLSINATVTWYVMENRLAEYYALGYLSASFVCAISVLVVLFYLLKNLIHITFLRERLPGERIARPPVLGTDLRFGEIVMTRTEATPSQGDSG